MTTLVILCIAGLLGLLILAVVVIFRHENNRHHAKLQRQITQGEIVPADGTERVLHAIEGVRQQVSSTGDELRGQHRSTKERVQWLISRVDELINVIAKFVKGIP